MLLSCAAVLSALTVLAPTEPATAPVVVSNRPISAGTTLTADDLTVRRVAPDAIPRGTPTDPAELVGRLAVIDLPAGAMLVSGVSLDPRGGVAKGEQLVPITLADPAIATLTKVGDRVTIIAAGDGGEPVVVAEQVTVAAVPRASSGGVLGGSNQPDSVLVVRAPVAAAHRIAAWATNPTLSITIG